MVCALKLRGYHLVVVASAGHASSKLAKNASEFLVWGGHVCAHIGKSPSLPPFFDSNEPRALKSTAMISITSTQPDVASSRTAQVAPTQVSSKSKVCSHLLQASCYHLPNIKSQDSTATTGTRTSRRRGRRKRAIVPTISPALPSPFQPLLIVLKQARDEGNSRPVRASIALQVLELDPMAYLNAGVVSWKGYAKSAEEAGLVQLGIRDRSSAWIALRS